MIAKALKNFRCTRKFTLLKSHLRGTTAPNRSGCSCIIRFLIVLRPTPRVPTSARILRRKGGVRATSSYNVNSAPSSCTLERDSYTNFFFFFDIYKRLLS